MEKNVQTATFAGGCFWCLEAVFQRLKGVLSVKSGYTGGHTVQPSYKEVCSGKTGHAEAVQIEFDSDVISYETLLTVFFSLHDPTTLNRQGGDIGTQYRSAVFTHDSAQYDAATKMIRKLEEDRVFAAPVVTSVEPAGIFYVAETEHDNYYNLNREKNSYCVAVIDPKISKLRKSYAHLLRD